MNKSLHAKRCVNNLWIVWFYEDVEKLKKIIEFVSEISHDFVWPCCSDFRNESNGIFVLGVGFFSSDEFRLFN